MCVCACVRSRLCVHSLIHSFIKIRIIFHTQIMYVGTYVCDSVSAVCARSAAANYLYIYMFMPNTFPHGNIASAVHTIYPHSPLSLLSSHHFLQRCVCVCVLCGVSHALLTFFSADFFLLSFFIVYCVLLSSVSTLAMVECVYARTAVNFIMNFDCSTVVARAAPSHTKKINTK